MNENKNYLKTTITLILLLALNGCGLDDISSQEALRSVDQSEVYAAQMKALEGISLWSIKKDQLIKVEQNLRIEINDPVTQLELSRTVVDVKDDVDNLTISMRQTYTEFSSSGLPKTPVDTEVHWREPLEILNINTMLKALDEPSYEYFNLSVAKKSYPVPTATLSRPNCGGFDDCRIVGTEIRYLEYKRENGAITEKVEYHMAFSNELPPLLMSPDLQLYPTIFSCARKQYYEEVMAKHCLVLRDVQR